MLHPTSSQTHSNILTDGEYYVFAKQEEETIRLGYTFTTWCGLVCGTHMRFLAVEIGKPLALIKAEVVQQEQGTLKTLKIDKRNLSLVDDIYERSEKVIINMRRELKYPQLDETTDCTPMIIVVNQGILAAVYGKDDFLQSFS